MTPIAALIAGLTTGGLTCLAVQGGLLLSVLAQRIDDQKYSNRLFIRVLLPVGAFLVAKLVSHTLLGLGLGLLGSKLELSLSVRLWLQVFAGLFMIISGIRLFFPGWLRWLELRPPATVRRFIRHSSRAEHWFGPAVLGFLTVLIPCGTTQAMELAAITTGNPWEAAAILFFFVLGTAPLFVIIGVMARGTALLQRRLTAVAAIVVISLGLFSMNGVLVAMDSPYSAQNVVAAVQKSFSNNRSAEPTVSRISIAVSANGYSPSRFSVPAGQPVEISLERRGQLGCTSLFTIPKLDVEVDISQSNKLLTTTFPEPGSYRFTCGMGMYSGVIEAV